VQTLPSLKINYLSHDKIYNAQFLSFETSDVCTFSEAQSNPVATHKQRTPFLIVKKRLTCVNHTPHMLSAFSGTASGVFENWSCDIRRNWHTRLQMTIHVASILSTFSVLSWFGIIKVVYTASYTAFSALTLLVGCQEEHACKNWLMRCSRGSVCSEVQMTGIWSHSHPAISCSSKIQNCLLFWYRLTQAYCNKGC